MGIGSSPELYGLSSGITVLVDEDIEAYENGTLVFYDKDKLPQTQ